MLILLFKPRCYQCTLKNISLCYNVYFIGSKNKSTPEAEVKRGPGRPRRYTAPPSQEEEEEEEVEEESSEIKPIEVNILSIQPEEMAEVEEIITDPPKKEKVNLGQVLELAVQSMSVTMETEEEEELTEQHTNKSVNTQITQEVLEVTHQKMTFESTKDHDSDFEWKLENEEDPVIHSPPAKKKKMTASSSFIVPTVSSCFLHPILFIDFKLNPTIFAYRQ